MKKAVSLFLALLMAFCVMLPLAQVASAASSPYVRLLYTAGDGTSKFIEFKDLSNLGSGDRLTASIDTKNKTLFLHLKNYEADGGIYVNVPGSSWTVFVSVSGSNTLNVHYNEITKTRMALGSNGALLVYPIAAGDTLNVTGNYGGSTQKALAESFYAFQGAGIAIGGGPTTQMSLNVNFNLNLTGYTAKEVYPFKVTAKNCDVTLAYVNYAYSYHSNYSHCNPENTPIILDQRTYFYTNYITDETLGNNAYHTLKYADTFTGLIHIEVKNGYYYGGAYAGEYNIGALAKRYAAQFDNVWKYHAIAKNCAFTLTKITAAQIKNLFSLPLAYGYKLPDRVSGSSLDAKIKWTVVGESEDLTGKTVEYGKKYRATVSFVPYGFTEAPTAEELIKVGSAAVPTGAYSIGRSPSTVNATSFVEDFLVNYNPILKPALKITQQPEDYVGSGNNRCAYFQIDTNDDSATYQWQKSHSGGSSDSEWTNLTDSYGSSGSVKIAGSKGKNLVYDFTATGETGVTQRYFRCVVTRGTDKLTSKVVKYTYAETTPVLFVVSKITVGGFNSQISAGDTFYNSPYVMIDGTNASWSGGGTNYRVEIVDGKGVWYEGAAGASVATPTTDTKFVEGKTYTFRLTLKNTVNSKFADSLTVMQDGTGRKPTKLTKLSDGRWYVDYTFGPIGNVIRRINLKDFVPPYNGMGTLYPTVRDDAGYKIDYGFTKGWYVDGSQNLLASSKDIGSKYYMNVFLYAPEGDEFNAQAGNPSISILDIRDRDGNVLSPYKVEYSFAKNTDGTPNFRYLNIKLTFECKETHITKGGTIKDLDMPAAGKALDTDVTLNTPQIDFQEMFYRVNGERVDASKVIPEEGDIIEIVFTFKEYTLGDTTMHFDKGIYTTWWIGGNEDENAVKIYRDTSYEDPAICAFTYVMQVPAPDSTGPETPTVVKGDVDGNGKIETADARLALRCSIGLESYAADSREFKAADVDGKGGVTTSDARYILRKSIGLTDPGIWA